MFVYIAVMHLEKLNMQTKSQIYVMAELSMLLPIDRVENVGLIYYVPPRLPGVCQSAQRLPELWQWILALYILTVHCSAGSSSAVLGDAVVLLMVINDVIIPSSTTM